MTVIRDFAYRRIWDKKVQAFRLGLFQISYLRIFLHLANANSRNSHKLLNPLRLRSHFPSHSRNEEHIDPHD
jgi:hypothetical protein